MPLENNLDFEIQKLPYLYQNIYGHPEYDELAKGIDSKRIAEKIKNIILQYQNLSGRKNIKVLDIGCCQGYFSFIAAELGCEVVAIDMYEPYVEFCKALNKEYNYPIEFKNMSIDRETIKTIKDFDIIFLFNVLHHIAGKWCYSPDEKKDGYWYAHEIIKEFSTRGKILLGIYATKGENYSWNKGVPKNYKIWFSDFKFNNEIGYVYVNTDEQKTYRPFVFASNHYSIDGQTLKNGIDKNLQSDYLIFHECSEKVQIFKKEMLTRYSNLVLAYTKSQKNYLPEQDKNVFDFHFEENNLKRDTKEYKYVQKIFKKNILGLTYALRAGRIVRTIFKEKNNELYFIREIVGTKDKITDMHYSLTLKDGIRKYVPDAVNEIEILSSLQDNEKDLLKEFEIYIAEAFRIFRWKDNLLKPEAYNIAPINCVKTKDNKYFFFDFEFELVDGVDKSYALYKCLRWFLLYINKPEKLEEYFEYFANKFNLDKKFHWCEYFEKHYACFVSPMYEGRHWDKYNNSFKVKFLKSLCKSLTCLIPNKQSRRKLRNKLIELLCYPNYRIARHCGLKNL